MSTPPPPVTQIIYVVSDYVQAHRKNYNSGTWIFLWVFLSLTGVFFVCLFIPWPFGSFEENASTGRRGRGRKQRKHRPVYEDPDDEFEVVDLN